MKNSSINHINQLEFSFGGGQYSTEGSFEKIIAKNHFRFLQNRISIRNY